MKKLNFLLALFIIHLSAFPQTKKVFMEEMTTARCGFCPKASFDLEWFSDSTPNTITVAHHAGFGVDAMTAAVSIDYAGAFNPGGAPSMTIDRIHFAGEAKVGFFMNPFAWDDSTILILDNTTAKLSVSITNSWNDSTREISGTIDVDCHSKIDSGDLRIHLFIVEDSVVGDTGNFDYDQKNYITTDPKYPELFGKPNPIPGFIHRHVVRDAVLGSWGLDSIISTQPDSGDSFSTNFSYFLPGKYDSIKGEEVLPSRINLVAFVSYYNADPLKRQILNAEESKLTIIPDSIPDTTGTFAGSFSEPTLQRLRIYPNPAFDFTTIDFTIGQKAATDISIFTLLGEKVLTLSSEIRTSGNYTAYLNTSQFLPGPYFVVMRTKDSVLIKRLFVE